MILQQYTVPNVHYIISVFIIQQNKNWTIIETLTKTMAVYVAWYDYKTLENTSTTELHWPLGKVHLTLRNENYGVLFFLFLVLNIVEMLLKLEEITNVFSENNDNLIFVRCKKNVLLLAPNVKWSVSNLMVKTHFCFECIFSLSMHMFRFSLYLGLNVPNGYSITKRTSLSV